MIVIKPSCTGSFCFSIQSAHRNKIFICYTTKVGRLLSCINTDTYRHIYIYIYTEYVYDVSVSLR